MIIYQILLTKWLLNAILYVVIEMTVYERIRFLREQKGLSQQELAVKVGFKTASAVNKIELGLRDLNQTKIALFAKALGVKPSYLLDGDSTESEKGSIYNIKGILPLPRMVKKPRLGAIACGEPILAEENIEAEDFVPEDISCDFTLICKGDSMTGARINDGDIVYIKQQNSAENGEIAACLIQDEFETDTTLKRYYKYDDRLVLQPENPKYPPLVYIGAEMNKVRIIGKAVGFTSKIN